MNSFFPGSINILIVDDSSDNVMVLEASLEKEGINVFTATTPSKALQLCTDNDISIALIDVHMPKWMVLNYWISSKKIL